MKKGWLVIAGVLAALLTAVTAGAAAGNHVSTSAHIGGVVPPQIGGKIVGRTTSPRPGVSRRMRPPVATAGDNLTYNGGRVMVDPHFINIYWVGDNGSGGPQSAVPARYQTIVNRYFSDVGGASDGSGTGGSGGKASTVFAHGTQYGDQYGEAITGGLFYNGVYIDTNPFPADSGVTYTDGNPSSDACGEYNDYPLDPTGLQYCFTDDELQAEIKSFIVANDITDDNSQTQYIVYTGKNVGSCFPDPSQPSGQACAYSEYCAYHGNTYDDTTGQDVIYANMPWPNQPFTYFGIPFTTDCAAGQYPNAGGATSSDPLRWDKRAPDEVINVSSHEMNEALTDPDLDAWWNSNPASPFYGYEDGDMCAWFTPAKAVLGGSAAQLKQYNQIIGGDHYYIQGEWSNFSANGVGNSGCVWKFLGPPVNTGDPWVAADGPFVGETVLGQVGTWNNNPTSYAWQFLRCNPDANNDCKVIKTGTSTPAQIAAAGGVPYKVLAVDDKSTFEFAVVAKNSAGSSVLDIGSPSGQVLGEPESGSPSISTSTSNPGDNITTLTGDVDGVLSNAVNGDDWGFLPQKYAFSWLKCDTQGNNCTVAKTGTITQPAVTGTPHAALTTTFNPTTWTNTTYEFSVVASNASGASDPVVTDFVSQVYAQGSPFITDVTDGSFTPGDKLAADPDSENWNPAATGFTYQWYHCTTNDPSSCTTTIDGATHQSYITTDTDGCVGIAVLVTPVFSQKPASSGVFSEVEDMGGTC
jgi:hypothetical protein